MARFTEQDVRKSNPALTQAEIAAVIAILNAEPTDVAARWAAENDAVVADLATPPERNRDGLTPIEEAINAWADARALPIPFPPG